MPSIGEPWKFLPSYFAPGRDDIIYDYPPQWPKLLYVWRAIHRDNQKTIIFKAVHEELLNYTAEEAKEESQVFLDEGFNHPNLIKVYDVIYQPPAEWLWYQLEYCEGGTLHDHIYHRQRARNLSIKRCLEITEGILRGLSYLHMHKEKLIHRDLKPGNIFFCKNGIPKIGDYEFVKSIKWQKYISTAGTPGYKAPEKEYDHRSDIYSVGIILKEMLLEPLSSPSEEVKSIRNKPVEKIVLKATVRNRLKRYQSAEEFLNAIREIKL